MVDETISTCYNKPQISGSKQDTDHADIVFPQDDKLRVAICVSVSRGYANSRAFATSKWETIETIGGARQMGLVPLFIVSGAVSDTDL